jgi:predicted CopG family antitoxin
MVKTIKVSDELHSQLTELLKLSPKSFDELLKGILQEAGNNIKDKLPREENNEHNNNETIN